MLTSNLTIQHRFVKHLVPFRFLRIGIHALKKISPYDSDLNKFLWLNSKVKFKRQPLYLKHFINAGIFYQTQLLDNEKEYMTFQSLTDHYPLLSSPDSFNDFVKLYTEIPESWENYDHSQRNSDHHFDPFHNAKQNAMNVWCSSKSVYL